MIIDMSDKFSLIRPGKINNTCVLLYVVNSQRSQPGIVAQTRIIIFKKIEGGPPYLVLVQNSSPSFVNIFYIKFSTYAKSKIVLKTGKKKCSKKKLSTYC
jgi:hypothetical protein